MYSAQTAVTSYSFVNFESQHLFFLHIEWRMCCSSDLQHIFSVDNGTREGLDKFLKAASSEPETVLHYEFMQDYKV
jgi:hypothetical protein